MFKPTESSTTTDTADHHTVLHRFLTWKLGCRDLAEDVLQETFLRLARFQSSDHSRTVEHPQRFLFRVASNLVIDYVRKKRLQARIFTQDPPSEEFPDGEPHAERKVYAKQRWRLVQAAVNELSPKCRQALLLNRLEGLTHAEIGRKLGVSESMVAKYIGQALRHCRQRLLASETSPDD